MHTSTLHPPNSDRLSDAVICTVMLRVKSSSHTQDALTPVATIGDECNPSMTEAIIRNNSPAPRPIYEQNKRSVPSAGAAVQTTATWSPAKQLNARLDHELSPRQLKRERRRLIQIRYRKRVRDDADALEKDVALLRQEVEKLELQRMRISPRILDSTTPFSVAAEWFRLFRFGLNAYAPQSELCNPPGSVGPLESIVQRDFVSATMTEDVVVHAGRGLEAVLEGWRLTSLTLPDFDAEIVRFDAGPADSVIATCKIRIVIAECTLCRVFSHLANCARGNAIASKLLGREFVVHSSTVFKWDKQRGRMQSVLHTSDLLTPIMHFLKNLDDLAFVFGDARVTPECRLILDQAA